MQHREGAQDETKGIEPADTDCVDADGEVWPEHDFDETECRRCGAEPDSED